jgi:hypothetical protein
MTVFSKLLGAAKSLTRRQIVLVVVVLLVLLGAVTAFSLNNDKGYVSVAPTAKTSVKGEVKSATTTADEQSKPAAKPTASSDTSTNKTAVKPKAKKSAPKAPKQVVAPPHSTTPPAQPEDAPVEPPAEEDYITVVAGEASDSYQIETDDGTAVYWFSCNAGAVTSDDQLPEKPDFKVYLVMESAVIDENGLAPASSVTFHVRATADAAPGMLEHSDDDYTGTTALAFCIADENYNIVQVLPIPVKVVARPE